MTSSAKALCESDCYRTPGLAQQVRDSFLPHGICTLYHCGSWFFAFVMLFRPFSLRLVSSPTFVQFFPFCPLVSFTSSVQLQYQSSVLNCTDTLAMARASSCELQSLIPVVCPALLADNRAFHLSASNYCSCRCFSE
jgi:hypothetical protein